MKFTSRKFWPLALLGAVLLVLMNFVGTADARGGRGGGRGGGAGGGGRGGGRGGRGGGRGGRGGNTGRNNNKEEQKRLRKEERETRVAIARVEYAKRERQELWDREDEQATAKGLQQVLDGATE